jgi:hypothetical protein
MAIGNFIYTYTNNNENPIEILGEGNFMSTKKILLLIMLGALILIFIGIISTQSLFLNQHVFEDTSSIGCRKCHDDIWQEVNSNSLMPHYGKNCTDCHQHPSVFATGNEHVAGAQVQCQACHPNSTLESAVLGGTKGFNFSANEAHWSLVDTAKSNTILGGANEACVACHTQYAISITFSRPDFYEFNIDYGDQTISGGLLNGTPDRLVVEGLADITNFIFSDDIFWRDVNNDNDWDPNEDIFRDEGDSAYGLGDTILYIGSDGKDSNGVAVEFGTEQEIFYLDSNHNGAYDYTTGNEEPLIYAGTDGGSAVNDTNLLTTHEVLKPYTGTSWVTDAIKFYGTNYRFLDNGTGIPGTFDSGEPIILDDGNGIIESGVLNGTNSSDEVVKAGYPNLSAFQISDKVDFLDINSDDTWNADEDIVFDTDDDAKFDYWGSVFDYSLYIGSSFDLSHNDNLKNISSNLKYIDSDHSGNYTMGEPIVNSTDLILDSNDELILREDDNYNNGTYTFGLWDFDLNPFTSEFFIDANDNGVYDAGEAIIRETYRIYNDSFFGTETSQIIITEATDSTGLHVYRNGSQIWDDGTGKSFCGDINLGCHQDVHNAINDNFGGGHYTNSTLGGHLESSNCSYCHRDSNQIDPDNVTTHCLPAA